MMQNNSSADRHELSFARTYQWSEPEQDFELAMKILTCPNIGCYSEDDPCALAESPSDKIRCALASHPSTPPTVLDHLAYCGIAFILVRIAENPSTHAETLRRLGSHPNVNVRSAVAENSNTPIHVQMTLACDECTDVRFALAENANVPGDVLEALARDENPYVAYRAQTTIMRLQAIANRRDASAAPAIKPMQRQQRIRKRASS